MGEYSDTTAEAGAWKQFWTGRARASEHQFRDARTGALLHGYWQDVLEAALAGRSKVSLIDLATGEGEVIALVDQAAARFPDLRIEAFASDIAVDAVRLAASPRGRFEASPVVADSAVLPLRDASLDLVLSQYGLEYAGPEAFSEAGRIVAPGGRIHALVHCRGGAVETACSAVASLLGQVIESELIPRMKDFVVTIPKAVAGEVSQDEGQACADALRQALETSARAAGAAAPGPARDHVARLIQDCQAAAGRLGAFQTADLLAWLDGQAGELTAFHHRMTSMIRVALSDAQMEDCRARLAQAGLDVSPAATLDLPDGGPPLAWVLDARREAQG